VKVVQKWTYELETDTFSVLHNTFVRVEECKALRRDIVVGPVHQLMMEVKGFL
jgi:hypothetical protein